MLGSELIIFLFVIYIGLSFKTGEKKPSTLLNYSKKLVGFWAVLISTVLTMPFLHIIVATFYCKSDDNIHGSLTCFSGIYYLHFVAGIIATLLYIFFLLLSLAFYIETNPFSSIPFASPRSYIPLLKLVLKLFFILVFTVDYPGTLNQQSTAVSGVFMIILLFFRSSDLPYYDRSVYRFTLACEGVLFWTGAVVNIHCVIY
jgi:hypothetical protein